jgi:hypothetical protein
MSTFLKDVFDGGPGGFEITGQDDSYLITGRGFEVSDRSEEDSVGFAIGDNVVVTGFVLGDDS